MICRADLIQSSRRKVQAAYELKASLGRGGVGRVVQADCRRTQITRAVKITSQKSDPSGFEVSLMSKLDHPNVVRLFETFVEESQGQIHLVMELCAGGALPSYAREFWPPLEEAAGAVIMWQLLGAVNYLHKQSLSHGDICPANVLMLHFDRPPEQNVTKLIDFGAHAGRRTHDLPSSGLVMRALLGWCSGMKGASLREAPVMKKGQAAVYSEGGLGVPISKAAGELLARFAGSEPDAAFTAEKALCHTWFIRARHGEVPLRKATSKRGAKPEGSTPRSDANGSKEAGSHGKKDKESGRRTRNKETKPRSDKKGDGTRSGGRGESSTGSRKHLALGAVEEKPVTAAGWWGSRAELPQNFVARLRAFCNVSSVSRAILLVAADCLEEEALAPLRAAFQRLDGWCPDGLLTVRKDAPKDLDRLLLEADVDGVGLLDYTTFLAIAMGAQELLSSELGQRVFNVLDRDQDGIISVADLAAFLGRDETQLSSGLAPLTFEGFQTLLTDLAKRQETFGEPLSEVQHVLSSAAVERLQLAMETVSGLAFGERSETIKAKRRLADAAAKKRLATEERRRKEKSRRRRKVLPLEGPGQRDVRAEADPVAMSLLVEDSSDGDGGDVGEGDSATPSEPSQAQSHASHSDVGSRSAATSTASDPVFVERVDESEPGRAGLRPETRPPPRRRDIQRLTVSL
ncbi:CPK3 [Symbiodinium microadriaticum]|nr:CPK3 [Symbiodinium microadriaticum]